MSARLQPLSINLRAMVKSESDLAEVFAIENKGHLCPWTERNFMDCLNAGYACRVAEDSSASVTAIRGFLVLTMAAGESHLLNICVDPDYQNMGIGQMLLNDAMAQSQEKNISILFLEVRPSNQIAIDLYLKNGFNEIGKRVNYYPTKKGREDALIYAKNF